MILLQIFVKFTLNHFSYHLQIWRGSTPPIVYSVKSTICALLFILMKRILAHQKSDTNTCTQLFYAWILYWQKICLKIQDIPTNCKECNCSPLIAMGEMDESLCTFSLVHDSNNLHVTEEMFITWFIANVLFSKLWFSLSTFYLRALQYCHHRQNHQHHMPVKRMQLIQPILVSLLSWQGWYPIS